jgi:hypothetical protein
MNIYNDFRKVEKQGYPNTFSKRFDEPTYVSFKLLFGINDDSRNIANNSAYFDNMPHPLLNLKTNYTDIKDRTDYAAMDYLMDANEFTRAELLKEFIIKLKSIQTDAPWYFQSVEGLQNLITANPGQGQRIKNDSKITINCLEGLDARMTYLLNLYRKIAWDDTYQRWILPDMMRYFTIDLIITEFRSFHISSLDTAWGNADFSNPVFGPATKMTKNEGDMVLKLFDNYILPSWHIKLEMCEFDITSFKTFDKLDVTTPNQQAVSFSVKVGNISETQNYPIFSKLLSDYVINSKNRSVEGEAANGLTDIYKNKHSLDSPIAQDILQQEKTHISGSPFNQLTNDKTIYRSSASSITDSTIATSSTDKNTWISNAFNFGTNFAKNFINDKINAAITTPIGGLGVSVTEAIAALQSKDIMTTLGMIRKAVTTVANESVSASENLSMNATTSRQISGGMVDNGGLASMKLADETFRSFLVGISKSTATDSDLGKLANLALTDGAVWNKIVDRSLATDLDNDSKLVINTPGLFGSNYTKSSIENPTALKTLQETQQKHTDTLSTEKFSKQLTSNYNASKGAGLQSKIADSDGYTNRILNPLNGDLSMATDLTGDPKPIIEGMIITGVPSSQATNGKII